MPARLFLILLSALAATSPAAELSGTAGPVPASPGVVIAHRGTIFNAPENTPLAYRWAEQIGADVIEADLRITRDGHLVMMHDRGVDRTTSGRGRVHNLLLGELRDFDAGLGQRVPTLEETLTLIQEGNADLLLDVKDSGRIDPDRLAWEIERSLLTERVLIGSRSAGFVRQLKARNPQLKTVALVPDRTRIDVFLELGVDVVRVWAHWVRRDPALADRIRAAGAEVWANSGGIRGAELEKLARRVDGLITDHPEDLIRIRR